MKGATLLGRYAKVTQSTLGACCAPAWNTALHCANRVIGQATLAPFVYGPSQGVQFFCGSAVLPQRTNISSAPSSLSSANHVIRPHRDEIRASNVSDSK